MRHVSKSQCSTVFGETSQQQKSSDSIDAEAISHPTELFSVSSMNALGREQGRTKLDSPFIRIQKSKEVSISLESNNLPRNVSKLSFSSTHFANNSADYKMLHSSDEATFSVDHCSHYRHIVRASCIYDRDQHQHFHRSKESEFYQKRCVELDGANRQLSTKLIESNMEKDRYMNEANDLRQRLTEVHKIQSSMQFPSSATNSQEQILQPKDKQSLESLPCWYANVNAAQNDKKHSDVFEKVTFEKERVRERNLRHLISDSACNIREGTNSIEIQDDVEEIHKMKKSVSYNHSSKAKKFQGIGSENEAYNQSLKAIFCSIEKLTNLETHDMCKLEDLFHENAVAEKKYQKRKHELIKNAASIAKHLEETCDYLHMLQNCGLLLQSSDLTSATNAEEFLDDKPRLTSGLSHTNEHSAEENQESKVQKDHRYTKSDILRKSCASSEFKEHNHYRSLLSPSGILTKSKTNLDSIVRENSHLQREMVETREELIDLKEHSSALEAEVREQKGAVTRSILVEGNLRLMQDANRELKAIITHKQNIIITLRTALTNLRSEAKELGMHVLGKGFESGTQQENAVLSQVDATLEAERTYSKMELLLVAAQSEKEQITSRYISLDSQFRSLQKQYAHAKRSMDSSRRENCCLKRELACARSEIATLQTNLRVDLTKRISGRRKNHEQVDCQLHMQELVKAKVQLAEMHEVIIRLRNQLSKTRPRLRFPCNFRGRMVRVRRNLRRKQGSSMTQ